jgi:microcystin-dependent protein
MSRVLDFWAGMTGTVLDFAGNAAPTGWLMCYGQSLLRTDYPNLFVAIGTTYGAADGTHFTLPDCRGRAVAGKDDMGGTAASRLTSAGSGITGTTLGAAGGAQTHTLDTTQIPAHAHGQTAIPSGSAGSSGSPVMSNSSSGSSASGSTSNAGGGLAHNNTQPTIVLNKIIKI